MTTYVYDMMQTDDKRTLVLGDNASKNVSEVTHDTDPMCEFGDVNREKQQQLVEQEVEEQVFDNINMMKLKLKENYAELECNDVLSSRQSKDQSAKLTVHNLENVDLDAFNIPIPINKTFLQQENERHEDGDDVIITEDITERSVIPTPPLSTRSTDDNVATAGDGHCTDTDVCSEDGNRQRKGKGCLHFPKISRKTFDKMRGRTTSAHGYLVEEVCSPVNTMERNQESLREFMGLDADLKERRSKTDNFRRFWHGARNSFTSCIRGNRNREYTPNPSETSVKFKESSVELPPDITGISNENADVKSKDI